MHLPSFAHDILQLFAKLLLVMAVFVPLERVFAARTQKTFRRAFLTDLAWYVVGGVLPKLLLVLPLSLLALALHSAVPGSFYGFMATLPGALRLALALVVGEIGFYWAHRLMHEVPALWRFHAIHHSAEEMDWLVNTRAHPIDIVFGRLAGLAPIYILGLAQPAGGKLDLVPVLFALIGSMWGFFIHANVKWRLGWLEWVVASPAFHHWHHTNDGPDVIDKNYASMLPWIDRLFGTHYLPASLPKAYGIEGPMPDSLAGQLMYPLRREDIAQNTARPNTASSTA